MSEIRSKAAKSVKVKDDGEVEVVFATLNVVDHDGDILVKEAFDDGAPVVISAYGHRSHDGALPIGKGRIVMSDDEAQMRGRFFVDTSHGRDAWLTIKALDEDDALQEWSFSLRDVESEAGKDRDGRAGNVITHVAVKEVSPVLEGAGINTRTLSVKAAAADAAVDNVESALRNVGRERWATDDTYVWVESFDEESGRAVFAVWKDDEAERLIEVSFNRDGDAWALGDDEIEVQRTVEFVPKSASARLVEQTRAVLADLRKLADRTAEVMARRSVKGKRLSPETVAVVDEIDNQVARLKVMAVEPDRRADSLPAVLIEIAQLEVDA